MYLILLTITEFPKYISSVSNSNLQISMPVGRNKAVKRMLNFDDENLKGILF